MPALSLFRRGFPQLKLHVKGSSCRLQRMRRGGSGSELQCSRACRGRPLTRRALWKCKRHSGRSRSGDGFHAPPHRGRRRRGFAPAAATVESRGGVNGPGLLRDFLSRMTRDPFSPVRSTALRSLRLPGAFFGFCSVGNRLGRGIWTSSSKLGT